MAEKCTVKNVTKKRESGMHGKIYERKILTLISLKCLLNKDLKDFWLLSNPVGVDKFDDVILLIEYKSGRRILFMIQIKHTLNAKRHIVAEKLDGKNPDFSLKVYQDAFTDIEKCESFFSDNSIPIEMEKFYIIYNNCEVNTEIENDNITFRPTPRFEYFDFIDSTLKPEGVLKLMNKGNKYDNIFLTKFFLYTNQLNEDEVDADIRKYLGGRKEIEERMTQFFFKWADPGKTTAEKLRRIDIMVRLLEIITGDLQPIPLEIDVQNEVMNLINEFDVTVISEMDSSKAIWKEILSAIRIFYQDEAIDLSSWEAPVSEDIEHKMDRSCFKDSKDFLTNLKGLTTPISTKLLFLVMVSLLKIPYFIRTDNPFFKTFKSFLMPLLNIKVVVFNVTKEILQFGDLKVCSTLRNVKQKMYIEKFRNIKISFQDKAEIYLHSVLMREHTDIINNTSIDHLIQLSFKTFEIGEGKNLPRYYVNRHLNIPVLEHGLLKNPEPLFIIMNVEGKRSELKKYQTMNILKYIILSSEFAYDLSDCNILTSQLNLVETLKYLKKIKYKNIYIFQELVCNDKSFLYLVYTNSSLDILRPFLTQITKRDEYIIDVFNKFGINIICNNAGMGKSTFLNFLYSHISANEWVVYLELGKYSQFFKDISNLDGFLEVVFKYKCVTRNSKLHDFSRALYDHLKYKMIWLIDDYEEVNQPDLLKIFKDAADKGVRIWIVARPLLKIEFEDLFNVFSMELTEFGRNDQTIFFLKYLKQGKKSDLDISNILKSLKNTRKLFDESFIGICQQTMMLAEIFLNHDKLWKQQPHRIDDLYEQFINIKVADYSETDRKFYIRTLSKLALQVFFTDFALAQLVDLEECMQDIAIFKSRYPRDFFIDGFGLDDIPIFSHKTYAEFLAARWLAHTANKQIRCETPSNVKDILRMLYFKELTTLRLFFDNILTKGLPIHSRIINRQPILIKDIPTIITAKTDLLGRSIFHIISGYGNRYEIPPAKEICSLLRNVDEHAQVERIGKDILLNFPMTSTNVKISSIKQRALEILFFYLNMSYSEHLCNVFKKDTFLKLLPIDCALLSGSLFELDAFLAHHKKSNNKTFNLQQAMSKESTYFLLYHGIQNDFRNILMEMDISKIDNINYIKVGATNMSLLHVAVASKNLLAVKELTKEFTIICWGTDNDGNTPLHLACDQNDDAILEGLLNVEKIRRPCIMGLEQFLNLKNNNGYSHLHNLAYRGNSTWIEKILQNYPCIDIDSPCNDGNTPLMASIIRTNVEVAKILQARGANVNYKNKNDMSALHFSASRGFLECTQNLVKWKAQINSKDDYGQTPLMKASSRGHFTTASFLLEQGADVNLSDVNQWTALHFAIRRNKLKIAKLLLKKKAKVNVVTFKGYTPLMVACDFNIPHAIKLLVNHGANIYIVSKQGETALRIAISKKHSSCIDALLLGGDPFLRS